MTKIETSDVKYKWDDIKRVSDYDNLCTGKYKGTCEAIVVVGKGGDLFKSADFTLGQMYIESVMKVSKNMKFLDHPSPKVEYLTGLGIFKVHTGHKPENIDFDIFGVQAQLEGSYTHLGTLVSTYYSLESRSLQNLLRSPLIYVLQIFRWWSGVYSNQW